MRSACSLIVIALLTSTGCAPRTDPDRWLAVREVTPSFLDSIPLLTPALAGDAHGRAALTFTTGRGPGHDLWLCVSTDSGLTFSTPMRVNEAGEAVVTSREGRPLPVFGPRGAFAVAWTERRAGDPRATDVRVRASGDGGMTLAATSYVNEDRPDAEAWQPNLRFWKWRRAISAVHTLPTLAFGPDGGLYAAWIDERDYASAEFPTANAALYFASSPDGGASWSVNQRLRDSVTMCARPAVLSDESGQIAIAYRRSDGHWRDPALAIWDGPDTALLDTLLARDGWQLDDCPPTGPSLAITRAGRSAAWYSGAEGGGLYLAPWTERGAAGVPRPVSDGLAGAVRPQLVPLGSSTLIAALGRAGLDSTHTVLALRLMRRDGTLTPWNPIGGDVEDAWVTGLSDRNALVCWIEREPRRLRVVRLTRIDAE